MIQRLLRITVTGFALVMMVTGAGCKKKTPPAANEGPSVEVSLQVTSMSPSTTPPQAAVAGRVYGSAFESGASVAFVNGEGAAVQAEGVSVEGTNSLALTVPALPEGSYDVQVTNPSGASASLKGGLNVAVGTGSCSNVVVNFDLDSSQIRSDARQTLDAQISCFQQLGGDIRVEGHCDERGTVDYNALLGQRRAESVKSYLVRNGVAASRVKTVSYGEERPIDTRHNESAWAANRRAEIKATE